MAKLEDVFVGAQHHDRAGIRAQDVDGALQRLLEQFLLAVLREERLGDELHGRDLALALAQRVQELGNLIRHGPPEPAPGPVLPARCAASFPEFDRRRPSRGSTGRRQA
ncbi:MAG: hypothetical protein FJX76_14345 [Armatimonadetes bacterium]|nr:hypothetical protein [Armatimonadota bacterium]